MNQEKGVKKMLKKMLYLAVIGVASCFFISLSQASEDKQHKNHTSGEHSEINLSHDLKVVLNQEMNGIEGGMMDIIPAIAAGNWDTIVTIAKKIKGSFILKQKLTEQQVKELHHSLPAEFIEIDQNFHTTAGKLAHAAHQQDAELVNFYFYKLHSQCITCHAKYASERFPHLKKMQQDHH